MLMFGLATAVVLMSGLAWMLRPAPAGRNVPAPAWAQGAAALGLPLAVVLLYGALSIGSSLEADPAVGTIQTPPVVRAEPAATRSAADAALAATAAALAETSAARHGPSSPGKPAGAPGAAMGADIEQLLERLTRRLQAQPDDLDGWLMLAHSSGSLGRHREAAAAYARASRLAPQDAQILADWADALAMSQGRSAKGEPTQLLAQALAIDPGLLKALVMSGSAALERGDREAALQHFQAAERRAVAGSPLAASMQQQIAQIQAGR
jgi:tetratricopeptide (TPR) repeat protein